MRVTFEKALVNGPKRSQLLWRVVDNKVAAAFSTHVVTSSVNLLVRETMAFWADETGEIVDLAELAAVGPNAHVACLEAAGFEVVNHVYPA